MGKSTLLLQALGRMAGAGTTCLLVTAEESCAQVRTRAERVGALAPNLLVVAETSLPHVVAHTEASAPQVLALDSIQTVLDPDLPGAPGSVTQVRDCAYRLVQQAKERELATVLIGHVTKEGTLAGPRVLEHVVDTVLSVDGDRGHSLRLLHALKHRFGGTHELGLFEMTALVSKHLK
jgi:DNA repair protein RadA/Sms